MNLALFLQRHFSLQVLYLVILFGLLILAKDLVFLVSIALFLCYLLWVSPNRGKKSYWRRAFMLSLAVGAFSFLFNHRGATTLFFFLGRRYTLESLQNGLGNGLLLFNLLLLIKLWEIWLDPWECHNRVDQFFPKLSLMLALAMAFIPQLERRYQDICDAEVSLYGRKKKDLQGIGQRMLSLLAWSLEDGVHFAQVLSVRDQGLKKDSYRFLQAPFFLRDAILVGLILVFGIMGLVLVYALPDVVFFPRYQGWEIASFSHLTVVYGLWCLYGFFPSLYHGLEIKRRQSRMTS